MEKPLRSIENRTIGNFRADQEWFRDNKEKLLRRYEGKRIAIIDGEIVDCGDDLPTLAKRVWARYGKVPIFMPLVIGNPRVYRVSPRPLRRA